MDVEGALSNKRPSTFGVKNFKLSKRTAKRPTAGWRLGREKSSTRNLCQEIQDSGSWTFWEAGGLGGGGGDDKWATGKRKHGAPRRPEHCSSALQLDPDLPESMLQDSHHHELQLIRCSLRNYQLLSQRQRSRIWLVFPSSQKPLFHVKHADKLRAWIWQERGFDSGIFLREHSWASLGRPATLLNKCLSRRPRKCNWWRTARKTIWQTPPPPPPPPPPKSSRLLWSHYHQGQHGRGCTQTIAEVETSQKGWPSHWFTKKETSKKYLKSNQMHANRQLCLFEKRTRSITPRSHPSPNSCTCISAFPRVCAEMTFHGQRSISQVYLAHPTTNCVE